MQTNSFPINPRDFSKALTSPQKKLMKRDSIEDIIAEGALKEGNNIDRLKKD
jgi:hypothetical protein